MFQQIMDPEMRATKGLLALLGTFFLIRLIFPSSEGIFALTPGNTLSATPHLWTLVTAGFYDADITMGLINLGVATCVAPVVERKLGSKGFVTFVLFVSTCSVATALFGAIAAYVTTMSTQILFQTTSGFSAVNSALAVGLLQANGAGALTPFYPLPKTKHLPSMIIVLSIALFVTSAVPGKDVALVLLGTFYGWLYLRFCRLDTSTGLVGDLRDEFSLVHLFPTLPVFSPLLVFMSTMTFKVVISIGCCSGAIKTHELLGASDAAVAKSITEDAFGAVPMTSGLSGGKDVSVKDPIADRRRAMAIKAIDEKLAALSGDIGDDVDLSIDLDGDVANTEAPLLGDEEETSDPLP